MDQWVGHSGIPIFNVSYTYIRKKNMIELQMSQDLPRGGKKFVVTELINYMYLYNSATLYMDIVQRTVTF